MDERGPSLPLGSTDAPGGFHAIGVTNSEGNHALLVRDSERVKVLVTVGTDARAGRLLVTPLDDGVEVRRDREAAAQWIASGSVAPEGSGDHASRQAASAPIPTDLPAWANVIGLALVIFIFGLTILGALTLTGWLTRLVGG